jgi:glycerol uptake facilitator protein
VTLGLAVRSGDFSNLVPYVVAQMLGAMTGAVLVWLNFLPHWAVTPEADLKLACFSTSPAIDSRGPNLLSEALGTFVLILVVAAIGSKATGTVPPGLGPYLVGMLVWAIGLSLGGTTGYAINPARDLGPRIMHSILPIPKKGISNWSYAPVPVIGPLVGGAVAGLVAKMVGF